MNRRSFLRLAGGCVAAAAVAQASKGTSVQAEQKQETVCFCDNFIMVKKQARIARKAREANLKTKGMIVRQTLYAKDSRIYMLSYKYGVNLVAVGDRPGLLFNTNEEAFAFLARVETGNEHCFAEGRYVFARKEHWTK